MKIHLVNVNINKCIQNSTKIFQHDNKLITNKRGMHIFKTNK